MSIYTKTGDKGETSLIGGKRVPKSDVHLDIYGTLDELSSFIGLLKQSTNEPTREYLTQIQETLIQINALYANDNEDWDKRNIGTSHHPTDNFLLLQLHFPPHDLRTDHLLPNNSLYCKYVPDRKTITPQVP